MQGLVGRLPPRGSRRWRMTGSPGVLAVIASSWIFEEVRRRAAGHHRSRSFMNRALADGYRADLVRAAHRGTGFDPGHR